MTETTGMTAEQTPGVGLISFLTARLDEEERHAGSLAKHLELQSRGGGSSGSGPPGGNSVTIMTQWLPARVRREIAAKRARLALLERTIEEMDRMLADDDAAKVDQGVAIGQYRAAVIAVREDAAIWSSHPDYRHIPDFTAPAT